MLVSRRLVSRYQLYRAAQFHSHSASSSASQPQPMSDSPKDINYAVLPKKVSEFIEEAVRLCSPSRIHVCDGSKSENENFMNLMVQSKTATPLPKYDNCWLVRTDPKDVARVESRTVISTSRREQVIPNGKNPTPGALGNWMSLDNLNTEVMKRFPRSMKGRTMYVIPFSMGPVGSNLSKIGIQLTDSPYVAASMRIMTRMGSDVLQLLTEDHDLEFVKCLHSVGRPLEDGQQDVPWPCNPEQTLITHKPESNEIISFGSGYGGNSLLGKKCLALRLGSWMAKQEGWLAEHMLILGITSPEGVKRYIAAAFPSACGKTNLAMMTPKLPGWKVECVGDDIAWMRFNRKTGMLHAINPENGFFGVAPGTSEKTNPVAMGTIFKNTVFTNTASTSDGGVYWEGMPTPQSPVTITSWTGESNWSPETHKTPAAHPNSRFCSPATQCPILDPSWEDPEGVPISAILFGGRRPEGVPLVYESYDWDHGVFIGASMRSEATAAAEFKGKMVMHDPFAMRPFTGYNMGEYFEHWLGFKGQHYRLPKIFHVNWFRKNAEGKFIWPGFGDNVRVLDWILRRVEGERNSAVETPIGFVPTESSFNLEGLGKIEWDKLFSLPKEFWLNEMKDIEKYFSDNIGSDLPPHLTLQLELIRRRFNIIN